MNILKGITLTAFLSLVVALLFAFFYRLPIPMGGILGPFGEYGSGSNILETIKMVFTAWVFYGFFGGFIVLLIFGVLAGYFGSKVSDTSINSNLKILQYSFIGGFVPVLFIATLDFIIGPW
jgi:hypothetical protein